MKCKLESEECGLWSVKCECKLWSVVWSEEYGMRCVKGTV